MSHSVRGSGTLQRLAEGAGTRAAALDTASGVLAAQPTIQGRARPQGPGLLRLVDSADGPRSGCRCPGARPGAGTKKHRMLRGRGVGRESPGPRLRACGSPAGPPESGPLGGSRAPPRVPVWVSQRPTRPLPESRLSVQHQGEFLHRLCLGWAQRP